MQILLFGAGALLVLAVVLSHRELSRAIRRAPRALPAMRSYPSLSVIRPIRGLDVGARENIAAALANGYPGAIETLFVFDDDSEPALPLVRQAIESHVARGAHGAAKVLFAGAPPAYRTGKLHAMIAGLRRATGELIAFADSDIRPGAAHFRQVVDTLLGTPRAGAAFVPVVVSGLGGAQTAGDLGAALLVNGLYGPAVALAEQNTGEVPFIMGQLMVFTREALTAIGGLEGIRGELVDDMHIGTRVADAGYRNVMSPSSMPIVMTGTGLGDFARMFRRWMIFSRSGLPNWSFKWPAWLRGIEFWLGLALTIVGLGTGHVALALVPAAAVVALCVSIARLHRAAGGDPIEPANAWVPFALLVTAPLIFLSAVIRPTVNWRGRLYRLDAAARLSPAAERRAA